MYKQSSYSFFSELSRTEQRSCFSLFWTKSLGIKDRKKFLFQVEVVAYDWPTYHVTKTERISPIHK